MRNVSQFFMKFWIQTTVAIEDNLLIKRLNVALEDVQVENQNSIKSSEKNLEKKVKLEKKSEKFQEKSLRFSHIFFHSFTESIFIPHSNMIFNNL